MDFNKLVDSWLSESQMEEDRSDYIAILKEDRDEEESAKVDEVLRMETIKRHTFFVIKENLKKGGLT